MSEENNSKVFRKVALDRLSSPEQLDQLMHITSPKGWLALLTILLFIVLAIVWGFVGTIPEKVNGQGILLRSGGVVEVFSTAAGRITDLRMVAGDMIKKGDVIARLDQPEIRQQITIMTKQLEELMLKRERIVFFGGGVTSLRQEQLLQKRSKLQSQIASTKERATLLGDIADRQSELLERGLITETTLMNTQNELTMVKEAIAHYNIELQQLGLSEVSIERDEEIELMLIDNQISQLERSIEQQRTHYRLSTQIVSPYDGRVLELRSKISDIIYQGQALLSLELEGMDIKELEAVLFFEAGEGKKIMPGMNVQLSPSTVSREEYGTLLARVTNVSEYVATPEGMMKVLGNEHLVSELTSDAAAIKIVADLIPDSETFSGYRWSSAQGPSVEIFSGTLAEASVTIRQRRPISLVLPFFRRLTGINNLF